MPLKHIHNLTVFDEIQKRLRPITITSITSPLQKFPQNPHSTHGNSSQFPYPSHTHTHGNSHTHGFPDVETDGSIATKLAHDDLQVSDHPGCVQGQGHGHMTYIIAQKSLLLPR